MKKTFLALFVLSAFLISCEEDGTGTEKPVGTLTLGITGLEDLGNKFVYEGWILVDEKPVSTGTFKVKEGKLPNPEFEIDSDVLKEATTFVLSIEPSDDIDPAPSTSKLLIGNFTANVATLAPATLLADTALLKDPSKLVAELASLGGKFFLRSPTDEAPGSINNDNDENGIWFGTPGMPPTSGLTLPMLAPGWVYEGWVVVPASTGPIPLSTGTFTEFNKPDSGNPFGGTANNAGPPVPGEDFLLNAPAGVTFPLDVRGKLIVISIEPKPDNSAAPFLLKPLVKKLPGKDDTGRDSTLVRSPYNFDINPDPLPGGKVVRSGN